MSDELTNILALDTRPFVDPILAAADKLEAFRDKAVDAMSTIAGSIKPAAGAMKAQAEEVETQTRTWREYGGSVAKSSKDAGSSLLSTAGPIGLVIGLTAKLAHMPGLNRLATTLKFVGATYKRFATDAVDSTKKVQQTNVAGPAKGSGGGGSSILPTIGTTAVLATLAYKAGLDEVISASARHVKSNSKMMESIGGVTKSLKEIVSTGFNSYAEGVKASVVATLTFVTGFESLTELVDYGAGTVTTFANAAKSGLEGVKNTTQEAGLIFGAAIGKFREGWGGAKMDMDAYIEEGRRLNEMAEESQRITSSLNAQKDAIATITSVTVNSENTRKLAIEQARISTIKSTEAIDAELHKMREAAAATARAGGATKEWKKYTTELTTALEKQRTALMVGEAKVAPVDSGAGKAIDAAGDALTRLNFGQDTAAIMSLRAAHATQEEIATLQGLQKEIARVTEEQAQQKKSEQLLTQGNEKIQSMKDEIDKLAGSATTAEIEMRKMSRAGFSQEQIDEVGALQAKLDGLRDKKKDTAKPGSNKAIVRGSSEAASVLIKGIVGSKNNKEKIAQDTLTVLKTIAKQGKVKSQSFVAGNFRGY